MKFLLVFWFYCLASFVAPAIHAQANGCHVRIGLLTCAPGDEIYATFGHTALRVQDSCHHTDYVYNYGTFNFDDPQFYTKFLRGRLAYFLSVDTYSDFLADYQTHQRSVWEEELNLDSSEKELIIKSLAENLQVANRIYRYDFIYDNCTTRIRDLILQSSGQVRISNQFVAKGSSARDLIHTYLDKDGQPWSKLITDILLGAKLDKPLNDTVAMFLPDYLAKGMANAVIDKNHPLVEQKRKVINMPSPIRPGAAYTPLIMLTFVCFLLAGLYTWPGVKAQKMSRTIDSLLFYLTGLLGLFLVFMWWGTDHTTTKENYNLLWAMPTNVVAFAFVWKQPKWLTSYFYIAFFITACLLISWFWLPQKLNVSLIPVVVLLLYRYGYLALQSKTL